LKDHKMNFRAIFLVLLVSVVAFASAFADSGSETKLKKAQEQTVFAAHAEALEMGLLGKARFGGPRPKLGRAQPPAAF